MSTSRIHISVILVFVLSALGCGGGGDVAEDVSTTDENTVLDVEQPQPDSGQDIEEPDVSATDLAEVTVVEDVLADCSVENGGCDLNASCEVQPEIGVICTCVTGYEGDGLSCTDVDECAGENGCDPNALCENSEGSYSCTCPEGFEGDGLSCVNLDECAGDNGCDVHASCVDGVDSYSCVCNEGFEGDGSTCTDVDECDLNMAGCGENALCTNTEGSFECACFTGFEGDGLECTDLDECADTENLVCLGSSACANSDGGYTCLCSPGYIYDAEQGDCTDLDECTAEDVFSCDSNATCTNSDGAFTCDCNAGFIGVGYHCSVDAENCGCFNVNECDSAQNNCDLNATCLDTPGSFDCVCNTGFEGDGETCVDVDECVTGTHECALDAVCTNTIGGHSCTSLCDSYCTKIGDNCIGDNVIDFSALSCLENCALWPEGFLGATTGNSVYCRILYGGALAVSDPDGNCSLATPDGGGMCTDNGGLCSMPKTIGEDGNSSIFGNAPSITSTIGSCDSDTSPGFGVWFEYLATESGVHLISANNATETQAHSRLVVYNDDSCGVSAEELGCATVPGTDISMQAELVAGMTYLIHFYSDGPAFTMVTPSISVQAFSISNSGQFCSTAEDVSGNDFPLQLNGDFIEDGPGGSCDTIATNGVWFHYEAAAGGSHKFSLTNEGADSWGRVAIYQNSGCDSLASSEKACSAFTSPGGDVVLSLIEGLPYKVHYYTDGESYPMVNPSISIEPVVVVAGGESCPTASIVNLSSEPIELNGFFVEDPAITKSCGEATAWNSIWFDFVPTLSGDYKIELNNSFTLAFGRVAVFDGESCGPLGTEVACATSELPQVETTVSLIGGQSYKILYHTDGDDWSMHNPSIHISPAL